MPIVYWYPVDRIIADASARIEESNALIRAGANRQQAGVRSVTEAQTTKIEAIDRIARVNRHVN